jgi:RNA polymerase sigma factor (sigma-70 family)
MDDKPLVRRAREGDGAARGEIFARCADMVFRIAMKFNRSDRAAAEDLTQKVFLKVFTSLESFGPPYQLDGWVARIAYNAAMDQLRGAKKERDGMREYSSLAGPRPATPEEEYLGREFKRLLGGMLAAETDDSCRETVRLFFEDGRSTREIGAAQGLTQTAVTTRLSRFRGRLLKKLAALALEER